MRVGLIGCGFIGSAHAESLVRLEGSTLAGVFDSRRANSIKFRARYGCRIFNSAEELIESPDCDAVIVASDPPSHVDLADAAVRANKHLLLQKPISNQLSDARTISWFDEASPTTMMAFYELFHPAIVRARELISLGVIGRPFMYRSLFSSFQEREEGSAVKGDIYIDMHSHQSAVCEWLLGTKFSTVQSHGGSLGRPLDYADTSIAVLGGDAIIAELASTISLRHHSQTNNRDFRELIEVFGDDGSIIIEPTSRPTLSVYSNSGPYSGWSAPRTEFIEPAERVGYSQFNGEDDPWVGLHRHFVHCAETGLPPRSPIAMGLRSLEIVLAARASNDEHGGARVTITSNPTNESKEK